MTLNREILDKFYNEYVAGIRREARKGAMSTPLSKAQWATEFTEVAKDMFSAEQGVSNTQLRKVNSIMINSAKEQLSRKQRNAFATNLALGTWRETLSPSEIKEVEQLFIDLGIDPTLSDVELRKILNFKGRELVEELERRKYESWWMFFNS